MGGTETNHSQFIEAVTTFSDYTCYRRGCEVSLNTGHCRRCGRHMRDFLQQTKSKPPLSALNTEK